jgi:hypothetical protein
VKNRNDTSDKEKDKDYIDNDLKSDSKDLKLKNNNKDNKIVKAISDEEKEDKWDKIDWSKKQSEVNKDSKWDKIDWSKRKSDEDKESKWDTIDWNKDRSENEIIEEYKYENFKDNLMNGSEFKEEFEDIKNKEDKTNENIINDFQKQIDDNDDDLSWLKDYDENPEDNEHDDLSWIKNYDEDSESKQNEDLDWIKDYDDDSEGKQNNLKEINKRNQLEDIRNDTNKENKYENLMRSELRNLFKAYYEDTKIKVNWGTKIKREFIDNIDEKINRDNISKNERKLLEEAKQHCEKINTNQEIQNFIVDKIVNTNLSQKTISDETKKMGIYVSEGKVRNIALDNVFINDQKGYDKRFSKLKWDFLYYDKDGKLLTRSETLSKAAEYFKNNVLHEEFRKNMDLQINEAPLRDVIRNYSPFISTIENIGITYTELLKEAGFNVNKEVGKWRFLKMDKDGNLLSLEQSKQAAVNYLKDILLKEEFIEKYHLKGNQAPTQAMLSENYTDFVVVIGKLNFTYNDLLAKAKFEVNKYKGKWKFLDQPSYDEAIKKAAEYLNNNILTETYKKINDLGDNGAPTRSILEKEHIDYVGAIGSRGLSYNDILIKAGYEPHDHIISYKIGKDFHWAAERIFMNHAETNGCISFYETYPSKNYERFKLNHCDNSIIVDENFRILSNITYQIPKNIKVINVDYYLGASKDRARNKCLKGYQGKEKMLVLVPLSAKESLPPPINIPYRKNVKILDPESFSKFMGYDGDCYNNFIDCVNLANRSLYLDGDMKMLEERANNSKEIIKKQYDYGQEKFEKYLKTIKRMDLLSYTQDKSSLDNWIDNTK